MKKTLILFCLSLLLVSCNQNDKVIHVERAFYCWKNPDVSRENMDLLQKNNISKIYMKLFEIDYSETMGNYPFNKNQPWYYRDFLKDSLEVIPTIFIKNEIFKYNDEKSLDKLADNIVYLIEKYSYYTDYYDNKKEKIFDYKEIQIDCDWTKSTKEQYFYLLKKIKQLSHKKISCTLRLYAYKYPKSMGVPPVDKAMLMCYNLIKPLSEHNKNSILDIPELKKYLDKKRSYPLHLDIALPTFYWTQMYQNNRFVKLIKYSPKEIKTFTKQVKPFWYLVERDTVINYEYFKMGDQLKCEEVSAETINQAIDWIKKMVSLDKNTTISLFDLDDNTFKQYSHEEISGFYNRFTE
ncbi:MAG: hypothetical protein H6Q25_911 [Bacteroidetes bacterium]|nr:hypothetical protein [Bacteroidota bacterium]